MRRERPHDDHGVQGRGPSDGPEHLSLPDTCPDRGSGWSFRSSSRYGRRSVKPSAQATLVRTQTFASSAGSAKGAAIKAALAAATQRHKALLALG